MTEDIEEILEKLPYTDWEDQEQRLAEALVNFALPLNKVADNTDKFSQPTVYKLRDQFQQLDRSERKQLVQHLVQFIDDEEAG